MKEVVTTEDAPKAIGPYSQAVVHGGWVFCSGQVGLDPRSGDLVQPASGGDVPSVSWIDAQTARVLENLRAVLAAAGCSFDDVVRTTIYLTDLAHFAAVNEVYGRYFRAPFPARATLQVAALPRGAAVEIDAIAIRSC